MKESQTIQPTEAELLGEILRQYGGLTDEACLARILKYYETYNEAVTRGLQDLQL